MSYASLTGVGASGILDGYMCALRRKLVFTYQYFRSVVPWSWVRSGTSPTVTPAQKRRLLSRRLGILRRKQIPSSRLASAASSLVLKRDVSDSLSTNEVNGLLGAKVDDIVHQSALSLKRDKEGSLSSVQTANLYQTKVDAVTALALKRDLATSLSAFDVAAALALKRSQPASPPRRSPRLSL